MVEVQAWNESKDEFTWLVGLQVTSLVAIAGAIFGLVQAVLNR
jgi:hypothetical protein